MTYKWQKKKIKAEEKAAKVKLQEKEQEGREEERSASTLNLSNPSWKKAQRENRSGLGSQRESGSDMVFPISRGGL